MMNTIVRGLMILVSIMLLSSLHVYAADIKHGVTHISQQELAVKLKNANVVLIDIRTQSEVDKGFIPGATHIPLAQIQNNISLLDDYANKELIFYCHSGVRVRKLTDYLQKIDHSSKESLYHLKGDMRAWRARGNEIQIQ